MLPQSPRKRGFPTDLWTLARTAELVEWKCDWSYDPSGVRHVMTRLNWSAQKTERQARERAFAWRPPCKPDLNPTKHVRGHTKDSSVAYFIPADLLHFDTGCGGDIRLIALHPSRGRSGRSSRIWANRSSLRQSLPPVARPPTGESSFRPTTTGQSIRDG
jgi:transposase